MQAKLFISDLHLSEQRPDTLALFQYFLRERVADTDELYVLGDLFDAWLGDDDDSALGDTVRAALRSVSARGTRVRIQHGNRDFLLGDRFAEESGCELLDETVVIDVGGEPTLLMHGDLLCTDDKDYQQARSTLRAPAFVAEFLARPLAERVAIAADYRRRSGEAMSLKAADIMDANELTVARYLRDYNVSQLIHGHTHRQATHTLEDDNGRTRKRHVLGDWSETAGSALVLRDGLIGFDKITLN